MIRKSMLVALLGWSLTGCVAYGDGGYGGGYRGYDRQYYSPGTHIQRAPVYVAPRVYIYEERRYAPPPRHYHAPPPPPPRHFNGPPPGYDPRYFSRHGRQSRDYRPAPRPGWEAQRHHYQQQQRPRGEARHWQQRQGGMPMRRDR